MDAWAQERDTIPSPPAWPICISACPPGALPCNFSFMHLFSCREDLTTPGDQHEAFDICSIEDCVSD